MSKFVKDQITQDIARRIKDVHDCLLVNVVGMDANGTYNLRRDLRQKGIHILVVKNNLARRACEGTPLERAFDGLAGSSAIIWGAEDFVSLAKVVAKLHDDRTVAKFEAKGGVLDGEPLTADKIKAISKWPNRAEQLSLLSGQILSAGANLAGALLGPGGLLASQLKEKSKGADEDAGEAAEAAAVGEATEGESAVGAGEAAGEGEAASAGEVASAGEAAEESPT